MANATCFQHPVKMARYRCEGCGTSLCSDCIDEGHRLLFCRLCGEQALPLAGGRPLSAPALKQYRATHSAYDFLDAFGYPFRGQGSYLLWGYIIVLTLPALLTSLLPLVGCLAFPLRLAVFVLTPGLVFNIIRHSAEGDNELPDWPDFSEFGARLQELLFFFASFFLAGFPVYLALRLAGCGLPEATGGGMEALGCAVAAVAGALIGTLLWVPAMGATSTYESFWLTFRLDLHAKALHAAGEDAITVAALVFGLFAANLIAQLFLPTIPLIGDALSILLSAYALFTSAHLIGLFMRRHTDSMERIYLH